MKNIFMMALLFTLGTGCIINKVSEDQLPPEDPVLSDFLQGECQVINKSGDIFDLMKKIKTDTKRLLRVFNEEPQRSWDSLISKYSLRIKDNSDSVLTLTRKEWTTPTVSNEIVWKISEDDFKVKFGKMNLLEPKVQKVFYRGEERSDLLRKVNAVEKNNTVKVTFTDKSTLLEYCQLNQTLMVVLEVKYSSLHATRTKFFNLHVNGESL